MAPELALHLHLLVYELLLVEDALDQFQVLPLSFVLLLQLHLQLVYLSLLKLGLVREVEDHLTWHEGWVLLTDITEDLLHLVQVEVGAERGAELIKSDVRGHICLAEFTLVEGIILACEEHLDSTLLSQLLTLGLGT